MRCILFFSITVVALVMVVVLSGCGESSTEPNPGEYYSLSGLVTMGGGDVSDAVVSLFPAPQDAEVDEIISTHPAVGFAQYQLMLFQPLL